MPEYRITEVHPTNQNQERFAAEVWLHENKLGEGKGRSIKAAEQAAAKVAFLGISQQNNP